MRRGVLASLMVLFVGVGRCGVRLAVAAGGERVSAGHGRGGQSGADSRFGGAYAVSDDMARRRAWYERNFLEGYKRAGRHDAKWDARAEEFIRLSASLFLDSAPEDSGDVVGRARTLVASGCDDPVVLYLGGLDAVVRRSRVARSIRSVRTRLRGDSAVGLLAGDGAIRGDGPASGSRATERGDGTAPRARPGGASVLPRSAARRQLRPRRRHRPGDPSHHRRGYVAPRAEPRRDHRSPRADALGRSLGAPLPLGRPPHERCLGRARTRICGQGEAGRLEGVLGEHGSRAKGSRGELASASRPVRGRNQDDRGCHGRGRARRDAAPVVRSSRGGAAGLDGCLHFHDHLSAFPMGRCRASCSHSPASARRPAASTPRCRSRPSTRSSGWRDPCSARSRRRATW
jgi:hypothetical protein